MRANAAEAQNARRNDTMPAHPFFDSVDETLFLFTFFGRVRVLCMQLLFFISLHFLHFLQAIIFALACSTCKHVKTCENRACGTGLPVAGHAARRTSCDRVSAPSIMPSMQSSCIEPQHCTSVQNER